MIFKRIRFQEVVLLFSLLASSLSGLPASASGTPAVAAPNSISVTNANTNYPISGVSVSGVTGDYLVVISLKNAQTNSYLKFTTTTGLSYSYGYGTSPNTFDSFTVMSFTGSQVEVNAALSTLALYSGIGGGSPSIEITATESTANISYFPDNGHYYEAVTGNISFASASAAAVAKTFQGQSGYLVTITSSAEENFILSKVNVNNIWIAATDESEEGAWRWETGTAITSPEKGKKFWDGTSTGSKFTGEGLNYANWCTGEPNNSSNEDYAVTKWNGGSCWNDLAGTSASVLGYVVEYGSAGASFFGSTSKTIAITTVIPNAPGTPTVVAGNASATVTVVAPLSGSVVDSYTVTASPGGAVCTVTVPATSCSVSGLTNGTDYTFIVVANNSAGSSASSPASSPAIRPLGAPGKPVGVPGNTEAIIRVTPPTGFSPDTYTVTSTPGSFTCTVTAPSDTCTVTSLTNGTAYTFISTAFINGVASPASVSSEPVTPIASTANTAIPTISGSLAVGETLTATSGTWTNLGAGTNYLYKWARSTDGSSWSDISGAVTSTYVLQSSDLSQFVRVTVTPDIAISVTEVDSNSSITIVKANSYKSTSFTLAGNATVSSSEITLTTATTNQAGVIFSNSRINLQNSFSTLSQINLGASDAGADGLAFVLQPNSARSYSTGGGLGYDGVANAFALEFDTFYNATGATGDISNDHAALMKSSATNHNSWAAPVIDLGNIEDNTYRYLEVIWVPSASSGCAASAGKLTIRFDKDADGVFEAGENLYSDFCLDLEGYFADSNYSAYFGFTAATGGATNLQRVKNIAYTANLRVNTAPVITTIPNTSVQVSSGQQSINVTVSEDNTSTGQWVAEISSSNLAVIPTLSVATPYPTVLSGTGNFLLRYTPSTSDTGTSVITLTLTDADGSTTSSSFTVTVNSYPNLVASTPNSGLSGTQSSPFSLNLSVSGGSSATYTYSTSSILPAGLTLNTSTGVLSGTPSASGTFPIVITAQDSLGNISSTETFNIVIASAPVQSSGSGIQSPITPALPQTPSEPTPGALITNPNLPEALPNLSQSPREPIAVRIPSIGQPNLSSASSNSDLNLNPTSPRYAPVVTSRLDVISVTSTANELIGVTPIEVKSSSRTINKIALSGIQISSDDWSLAVTVPKRTTSSRAPENVNQLEITVGDAFTTFGRGFKPNSQIDIYLFSTPIWLGSTLTDRFGNYKIDLPIPNTTALGNHIFQVQGRTKDNVDRIANAPFILIEKPSTLKPKPSETPKVAQENSNESNFKKVDVIGFNLGKIKINTEQMKQLKNLDLQGKGKRITLFSYAKKGSPKIDLRISRAFGEAVNKAILELNPRALVKIVAKGSTPAPSCKVFSNRCVVVRVG